MAAAEGVPGAFDVAYVINLPRATERWKAVQHEFAAANLVPTRIAAVEGAALSDAERRQWVTPTCAAWCPLGVIGCAASHILAWRAIAAAKHAAALVCEDDVTFEPEFVPRLKEALVGLPPDWDVVYLGSELGDGSMPRFVANIATLGSTQPERQVGPQLWVPHASLCLHAYMVSARGASRLLAALDGGRAYTMDHAVNDLAARGDLNVFVVRPLLARQRLVKGVSSIATCDCPRWPTAVLDHVMLNDHVSLGYMSTVPLARVTDRFVVTPWTVIFVALGIGFGAAAASPLWLLLLMTLLLAADLCVAVGGNRRAGTDAGASLAAAVAGWLLGASVRWSAAAMSSSTGAHT